MIHRYIRWLARASALMGGLVLVALVVLMTTSIAMRSLNLGEINGAYEILEAGVGFAIFAFFPICQFYGAHATVDVFTSGLPLRFNRVLNAFWEIVLTITFIFVTFRLFAGMERYLGNGETTLFLQFPVWWGYAASMIGATAASITGVYCAIARVRECAGGEPILPSA